MATGLITKQRVDALCPGAKDIFLWDTGVKGFGVKITPKGTRTYIYQYRMGGRGSKVRRYTIGLHGAWTPDAARKEARKIAQMVDQGIDPATEKQKKQRDDVTLAFSAYAERFIDEYLRSEWQGGFDLAEGLLKRFAIPTFRQRPISAITRADISSLMDKLADRPASRRNTFTVIRKLFRWAVNRGDLQMSPIQDMEPPPAPASRDRTLSDDELGQVWLAAETQGYPFGDFVKFLILTGQRREEVSQLQWSEIDQRNAMWTIPSQRAKNGLAHDVPLTEEAIKILGGIAARTKSAKPGAWPKRGFVFTSTGKKGITGYSVAKRQLDEQISGAGAGDDSKRREAMNPWRFHDLRRTLATGMQKLDVRFEVTEAILNHRSGATNGVAGVYQRHNWASEKRVALDRWSTHVANILQKSSGTTLE